MDLKNFPFFSESQQMFLWGYIRGAARLRRKAPQACRSAKYFLKFQVRLAGASRSQGVGGGLPTKKS